MNKSAIKNFAIEARKILIKSAVTEAGLYGISIDSIAKPIQSTSEMEIYENLAGTETRIYGDSIKQRRSLVSAIDKKGFENVMEEVAYTWFNRLIAIRFMEVNDYLPSRVRVLSSETPGKKEPDLVTNFVDSAMDLNISQTELETIQTAKDNNKYDDAFRILFMKQCNALNEILPALFEKTSDYTELLLRLSFTNEEGVVRMLIDTVSEEDFNVSETDENGNVTGQVEIIGWLYQYYNTELKDDTFAKLKKNVKITKERIPAATQLFTPDWIVCYMVENTVGRIWIEHLRANNSELDEKATAEEFGWKYYLPEAEQDVNVISQLVDIRKDYKALEPQDITCIDPCMGSGHILVYMFDVLMDIYKSAGFTERESAFSILEHNIHGLDIDQRAYQLSYFALMMKARGYNRRFFFGKENLNGEKEIIEPQVYSIQESNNINTETIEFLTNGDAELEKDLEIIIEGMQDAKEYGSIIRLENVNFAKIFARIQNIEIEDTLSLFSYELNKSLKPLLNICKILNDKYYAVVTNPPYMGVAGMNKKLFDYVTKFYPNTKSDLSTVCMEKTIGMCENNGYMAMINIPVWMFIASYKKLREDIINNNTISEMLHLGRGVFGSDFGTTAFVINRNNISGYRGLYKKLYKKQGAVDSIETKEKWFFEDENTFCSKQNSFLEIPGSPIAYWVSNKFINNFQEKLISNEFVSGGRNKTHGNEKYTRKWWEISDWDKWQLYVKGGDFRRWYGNQETVVNWSDEAKTDYASHGGLYNQKFADKVGICWTLITSAKTAFRVKISKAHYDSGAPTIFNSNYTLDYYTLGFLNSNVATEYLQLLNPTINMGNTYVLSLPLKKSNEYIQEIEQLVQNNIELAKTDWDSFENSMDFVRHPLVNGQAGKLSDVLSEWENICNNMFSQMQMNESRLNQLFVKIYGLENEIDPTVLDKDISIQKSDLQRDIRSLISYIVGCMFGRYSLDKEKLVYIRGEVNPEYYKTYSVDKDNIIPICDNDYFEDDILGNFINFIKVVYGEDNLEDNLSFIANSLGGKGTNREIIRNYFVNEFYSDHCKMYQNRPFYWLFDSGKENGFKALIYMHRYDKDTVARIRTDYLHKTQSALENALKNAEYIINTTTSATDRTKAKKAQDKYMKQLAETRIYDQALAYVANQRIEIDLDDGVKHNYELFQNIEISNEGSKKQTINLLAKI